MKALVYSAVKQTDWLHKYFQNLHPYLLKIANKPVFEYFLDFCSLNGIEEIRFVSSHQNTEMEYYFGSGDKWGVNISYSIAKPGDSLKKVILKNNSFCKDADILVFNGYGFLHYDKNNFPKNLIADMKDSSKLIDGDTGIYFIRKEDLRSSFDNFRSESSDSIRITEISNIKLYYDLNFYVLHEESSNYVLPGYNNEEFVFLGKNIIYPKSADLKKPIILGDNVQLKADTEVGPEAIIGNNVIIDNGAHVKNSIVYDLSYIGSELDIDNKIVYKDVLIDPDSGESMKISDAFLISGIQENMVNTFMQRFFDKVLAGILIGVLYMPEAIIRMLINTKIIRQKSTKFYAKADGSIERFLKTVFVEHTSGSKLFYRFLLDKYPLLFDVLTGKINLVGCRLVEAQNDVDTSDLLTDYRPGVFQYSEIFPSERDENQVMLDDMYYLTHKSLKTDISIVLKAMKNRLSGKIKLH